MTMQDLKCVIWICEARSSTFQLCIKLNHISDMSHESGEHNVPAPLNVGALHMEDLQNPAARMKYLRSHCHTDFSGDDIDTATVRASARRAGGPLPSRCQSLKGGPSETDNAILTGTSTSSDIASLDTTTTSVKAVDEFSQSASEKDCSAKSRCDVPGESPMMAALRGAKGMRRHRWYSDDQLVRARIVLGTTLLDRYMIQRRHTAHLK